MEQWVTLPGQTGSFDTIAILASVQTGHIRPLGPEAVPSGFVKTGVAGSVAVHALGLDGDEQADLSVHGGPEKAVYGYAASNYALWRADFPQHRARLTNGAFGENLTIDGLDEAAICVGDVHRIGTALLQVCQPRQPCFKLALHFEDNRMPKAMVKSGRAGWYYRVLEPGVIRAADAVSLHARPHPDFPFARLVQIVSHGGAGRAELARMAGMPALASQWRAAARKWLEDMPAVR